MSPPNSEVVISFINYDGAVARTEADEYVEVENRGSAPQDVSGWRLSAGDRTQDFIFPRGTSLEPGHRVRIYTNRVEPGGFTFGSRRAIWNNRGDTGQLLDADGTEISRYAYGHRAAAPHQPRPEPGLVVGRMRLSPGMPQAWTELMQAKRPLPNGYIGEGTPVTMARATFPDGTQIIGGILKGDDPKIFNPLVMWVTDARGRRAPDDPFDIGDYEDFSTGSTDFAVDTDADEPTHLLVIEEAPPPATHPPGSGLIKGTLVLPKGEAAEWNALMVGERPVPEAIPTWSPIVMAHTRMDDGTQIVGGIMKGDQPETFNPMFLWAFDEDGNLYSDATVDTSDDEDFALGDLLFAIDFEADDATHLLSIEEASA